MRGICIAIRSGIAILMGIAIPRNVIQLNKRIAIPLD
jgi:hypothetical protein